MNDNPILLHVRRAREEAEQLRIMERAPAESTPLEKVGFGAKSPGVRKRPEGLPALPPVHRERDGVII